MQTHELNMILIEGLFPQGIASKIELQSTANNICDCNTVSLNQLSLVTSVLDFTENRVLNIDDERCLCNGISSFKSLLTTLTTEVEKPKLPCLEAFVAVKVLVQCYYHNPVLCEANKIHAFILKAIEKDLF